MAQETELTAKEAAEWIRMQTPITVGKWLRAIDKACAALDYMEHMKTLHSCNDCGQKGCHYKQGLGEDVRYNCIKWRKNEG